MSFAYGSRSYGGGAIINTNADGVAIQINKGELVLTPGFDQTTGGIFVTAPVHHSLVLGGVTHAAFPGVVHDIAPTIEGINTLVVTDFKFDRVITLDSYNYSTVSLEPNKAPYVEIQSVDPWYNNNAWTGTSTDATPSDTSGRSSPWIYRRNVDITAPPTGMPKNHPIELQISKSVLKQNKMRDDFEDIVVARLVTDTPEEWQVLSHDVVNVYTDTFFTVRFPLAVAMDEDEVSTSEYYVYYGNKELLNMPRVRPYTYVDYPMSILPIADGVTYTNPEVDWTSEGVSDAYYAKATYRFYGPQIKIFSDIDQEYGIMEVQIDNDDWVDVDLFSHYATPNWEVYEARGLDEGVHTLRIRVSGAAHPSATSTTINFTEIQFKKHSVGVNVEEQANRKLGWDSVIGGIV